MADSSLNAIRTKARRLTRSPSAQQITDAEINEYINTFLLYDLPSELRLFNLKRTFTFYTEPNVDTYSTNTTDANNPLFNFKNVIITSGTPIYVNGYKVWLSQSREEFFARWDIRKQQEQIAIGDGATTNFSGTLTNFPALPTEVLFTSIQSNGESTGLVSLPVLDSINGFQTQNGNFYNTLGPIPTTNPTTVDATNTINFSTGVYNITFLFAPGSGQQIFANTVPVTPSRPTSVLYFNNTFTLRPVPDQQYDVNVEVYIRPTALLAGNQSPELEQWWQYIAYGASIKILEDRTDFDTVQQLLPMFQKQEELVLNTTLVQQGDRRATTIFSQQTSLGGSPFGWWNGNGF